MVNPLNEVTTISEAANLWGMDTSTIRWAIIKGRFKKNEYRKTGRSIVLLKSAMIRVYGEPKKGE